MDVILTAGGIPLPEDPLYSYTQGHSKAMVDVAGKPMIQWVLDALSGAKHVEHIVIIGLTEKSGLTVTKPVAYIPNQGGMLANILAGIDKVKELNPQTGYVLLASSDIPAIKPAMVDWLVETSMQTEDDLYYGVVPRAVMEATFPNSKRTYTKLKDLELCGADINIAHVRMAGEEYLDLWERLIGNRKSPMRQAGAVGFDTLFLLATRQITLDDAVRRVCKRIGIKGRAIVWQYAEAGMDVDKPHQLEILREYLSRPAAPPTRLMPGAEGAA
jgi:molybdopterin-guanine dinucleotide biosynthesis protein A